MKMGRKRDINFSVYEEPGVMDISITPEETGVGELGS